MDVRRSSCPSSRGALAALALFSLACGVKGQEGGADASAPPDPKANAAAVDAVQAKVPKDVALTFEAVPGEKDRHLAIQPKGWETGVIPGRLKPPAGSPLGFMLRSPPSVSNVS